MYRNLRITSAAVMVCLLVFAAEVSAFPGKTGEGDDICDDASPSPSEPDAYTGATAFKGKPVRESEAKTAKDHYEIGRIYLERKDYEASVEWLDKAIELDPAYAEAYYVRGKVYLKLNRPMWAIEDFFTVTRKLNPDDVRLRAASYYAVGHVWLRAGVLENAIEHFTMAIELKSDEALFFKMRGIAHRQMNNYQEALKDFDRAVHLNPHYCESLKVERRFLREMIKRKEEKP